MKLVATLVLIAFCTGCGGVPRAIVSISPAGSPSVDGRMCDWQAVGAQLKKHVKSRGSSVPVTILADAQTPYIVLRKALDAAALAGAIRLKLTETPSGRTAFYNYPWMEWSGPDNLPASFTDLPPYLAAVVAVSSSGPQLILPQTTPQQTIAVLTTLPTDPHVGILVQCMPDAQFHDVVSVLQICHSNGIRTVFLTEKAKTAQPSAPMVRSPAAGGRP